MEKLQNAIIRKILEIKDPVLLDFVNSVLAGDENSPEYKFSDKEKSLIKESLADYKAGNTTANSDVMNRFDKWLEK